MLYFLSGVILILLGGMAALLRLALRYRQRLKGRPNIERVPIPHVALADWDPIFRTDGLGPSRESEVLFVGGGAWRSGTNDTETWVLAALAKRARRIFEFGTATGRTTYVLARNAPDDAIVDTITLLAGNADNTDYEFKPDDPDAKKWRAIALGESVFDRFYYEGTSASRKIRQHFGDSAKFDEAPFSGQVDLVFIDGSHAYSYVRSDTEKAMRMLVPGGCIVWHDYSPRCPGVFKALNELGRKLQLVHLKDTRLVVYRAPAAA